MRRCLSPLSGFDIMLYFISIWNCHLCIYSHPSLGTDTLIGNEANNKLYGGAGSGVKDTLTGGSGNDIFICSIESAASDISVADWILDFTPDSDKIGLEDGEVSDVAWSSASGGTKIYDTQSDNILFYLDGIDASLLDADDFVLTDFV